MEMPTGGNVDDVAEGERGTVWNCIAEIFHVKRVRRISVLKLMDERRSAEIDNKFRITNGAIRETVLVITSIQDIEKLFLFHFLFSFLFAAVFLFTLSL
jgi:hypothetical protein